MLLGTVKFRISRNVPSQDSPITWQILQQEQDRKFYAEVFLEERAWH